MIGYNADGPASGDFHVLNVITGGSGAGSGGAGAGAGGAGGAGGDGGAGGGASGTATAAPSYFPGGQGASGAAGTGQNGGTGGAAGSTQTGAPPQATQASSYTTGSGGQIATSINTRPKPGETGKPKPHPQANSSSSNAGRNAAIIGSIVGCACLVFLALILFFWCRRRKRDEKYQKEVAQRRLMKEGDAEAWAAHTTPPSSPKGRFAGMAALGAGAGAVAATLRKISGGRNPEYQAVATDEPKGGPGIAPKRRSTRYVGQKMRLVGHSEGHDPFSDNYSEDLPFEGSSTARTSAFGPGIASTEVGMRQRQVSNEHSPILEEDEEIPIGGRWATANLILSDSNSDTTPAPTSPTRMSRASFMASEDDFNLLAPIPRRPLTEGALLAEVPSRGSGVSGASTSGTSIADLANASVEQGSRVPLQSDAPMLWDMANKAPVPGNATDFAPFSPTMSDLSGSDLVPPAMLLRLGDHSGSESSSVNSKHRMVARAIAEPRGIGSEHGEIDETSFRDSRSSRASAALDGQYGVTSRHTFGSMEPKSPYYFPDEDPDATPVARHTERFGNETGLSDLIPDFGSTPSSLIRLNVPSVLERGGSDSSGTYSASTWGSNGASHVGSSFSGKSGGSTAGTWATAASEMRSDASEVGGSEVSTTSTVGTWTTAEPQAPPEIEEELAALRDTTPLATPRLSRVDTNPDLACVATPRVVSSATITGPTGLGMRNVSVGDSPGAGSSLQRSGSGSSTMAVVGSQPSARERALNRSMEGIDPPQGLGEFKSPPPSLAPSLPPSPREMQPWPETEFAPTCRPSPSASVFTVPTFPDPPDPFQDPPRVSGTPGVTAGSAGTAIGAAVPVAVTAGGTAPLGGTEGVESDVSDAVENLASPVLSPAPSPKPQRTLAGMAGLGGGLMAGRGMGRLRPVREAIDSINRRGAGLPSRFASGGSRDFTPTPPKNKAGSASPAVASPSRPEAKTEGREKDKESKEADSPLPKKQEKQVEFHLRPTHRYAASPSSFRTAAESKDSHGSSRESSDE